MCTGRSENRYKCEREFKEDMGKFMEKNVEITPQIIYKRKHTHTLLCNRPLLLTCCTNIKTVWKEKNKI